MNGTAAVALTIARDLPAQSGKGTAGKPDARQDDVAEAVASAAAAIAMGLADFADGARLSPGIKELGGRTLAKVAELQLDYADGDTAFAALARREGRRVLERRYGAMLRGAIGATKVDAAFGELIDHVLVITTLVVADERVLRTN
jgi:hypothetical protein